MTSRLVAAVFLIALGGCSTVGAQAPAPIDPTPLLPTEATYVERTASAIYRGASTERLRGFLFSSEERGHGVCVRSPAGAGERADYTLLVLSRRIAEDFIPQTSDDVLVLRSRADAAPCRRLGAEPRLWVRGR